MYRWIRSPITRLPDPAAIERLADGAIIPADAGNRDWRDYQAWLAAGNVADPAP